MAGTEHEKLEELFTAALAIASPDERASFLEESCDDPRLVEQVLTLLDAHSKLGSFLDTPPIEPHPASAGAPAGERPGDTIGRYKLLREIGEGGFGSVFMAEQMHPVRRLVALKILKLGMESKQVIARFEAERQALALMDHPNIAMVLDAGATETGRPYVVMELVKGDSITEYCDRNALAIQDRLALFLPVCHAVQHAHQKGIIHRDLKPNNVLVTVEDGAPVPKIIDFGIAKATSQRLTDRTLVTEFRQFLGTPEYMSPDQADPGATDVDTRTDIYSLGVLLYELLTGVTPFDPQRLRRSSYAEIQRIIRDENPPRPSARFQAHAPADQLATIAARRDSDPATLHRLVRGDLDWIVVKAMEKDRTRRYATAKDLSDDIERHLANKPVSAGPPGAAYQMRKFVRRHRLGVLAGILITLALVLGLSAAVTALVQVDRARIRLQQQAQRAAALSGFLQDMLRSVDPTKALGREVSVRFILDEAAARIDAGDLADQPEVDASVRMTLGETYTALGLYDAALERLRQAQEMRRRTLGLNHQDTLRTDRALARVLRITGAFAEAERLLRQTAQAQQGELGRDHTDTLDTLTELALTLCGPGRFAEAEEILHRVLDTRRARLGTDHADTIRTMGHLGRVYRELGRTDEAETLLRGALQASRRELGEDHPATSLAMTDLGLLLEDRGDFEGAGALYDASYQIDHRVLGPDHPDTQARANNLIRVLLFQDRIEETRPLVVERLARLKREADRADAPASAAHAYAWDLLTCQPADLRDPHQALPYAARAVELDGGMSADYLDTLSRANELTGDLDGAIQTQRRAIAKADTGAAPEDVGELESRLVSLLVAKGDIVALANESWRSVAARVGSTFATDSSSAQYLVDEADQLMTEGRFEEAITKLNSCLALRKKSFPDGHWLIADAESRLGAAITGTGRYAEAEPILLGAYRAMEQDRATPYSRRREAIARLVTLYDAWPKPEEGARWRALLPQSLPGSGL